MDQMTEMIWHLVHVSSRPTCVGIIGSSRPPHQSERWEKLMLFMRWTNLRNFNPALQASGSRGILPATLESRISRLGFDQISLFPTLLAPYPGLLGMSQLIFDDQGNSLKMSKFTGVYIRRQGWRQRCRRFGKIRGGAKKYLETNKRIRGR